MFWSSEDRVRDADHRNLNGIYTDGFYSLKARNLWRKSLLRVADARNEIPMKYNLKTKSLLECALPQGVTLG